MIQRAKAFALELDRELQLKKCINSTEYPTLPCSVQRNRGGQGAKKSPYEQLCYILTVL